MPKLKRVLLVLLAIPVGLVCLLAILYAMTDDERQAPTSIATGPAISAASLEIHPPNNEEKDVKKRLRETIRESINGELVYVHLAKGGELKVTFRTGQQDSIAATVLTVESDIARILRCAREANQEHFWKNIEVIVVSFGRDSFGRNTDRPLFDASYSRSTVRKIRWDSFEVANVAKIRDGGPGWQVE